jgi:hypothetical protein
VALGQALALVPVPVLEMETVHPRTTAQGGCWSLFLSLFPPPPHPCTRTPAPPCNTHVVPCSTMPACLPACQSYSCAPLVVLTPGRVHSRRTRHTPMFMPMHHGTTYVSDEAFFLHSLRCGCAPCLCAPVHILAHELLFSPSRVLTSFCLCVPAATWHLIPSRHQLHCAPRATTQGTRIRATHMHASPRTAHYTAHTTHYMPHTTHYTLHTTHHAYPCH